LWRTGHVPSLLLTGVFVRAISYHRPVLRYQTMAHRAFNFIVHHAPAPTHILIRNFSVSTRTPNLHRSIPHPLSYHPMTSYFIVPAKTQFITMGTTSVALIVRHCHGFTDYAAYTRMISINTAHWARTGFAIRGALDLPSFRLRPYSRPSGIRPAITGHRHRVV
jgi:hypothetical protein